MLTTWTDLAPVYDTGLAPAVNHLGQDLVAIYGKTPSGLLIGGDGMHTIVFANGKERVVPAGRLAVDIIHDIAVKKIVSTTGDGIWVAFD